MASIAAQEDPLVQSVSLGYALADGVDGVPLYTFPLDGVGLQDLLCRCLHLCFSGRLPRVEVGICGGGNLDIQPDHVIFTRDHHDRPVF